VVNGIKFFFNDRGRAFEMVEGDGRVELRLRLGAPQQTADRNFKCPVQICGMHNDRVFEIVGEDSLQALQLALKFAAALLHAKQEQGSQITWFNESDLGL
jgi:hypothetical protein